MGDLSWLKIFDADWARITALSVFVFGYIFVRGIVPIFRMFFEDRKQLRTARTKQLTLIRDIEREQGRRKEGRLDLDP